MGLDDEDAWPDAEVFRQQFTAKDNGFVCNRVGGKHQLGSRTCPACSKAPTVEPVPMAADYWRTSCSICGLVEDEIDTHDLAVEVGHQHVGQFHETEPVWQFRVQGITRGIK